MATNLPEVGSTVRWGRSAYTVVRHGCATDWDDCPHGARAITVEHETLRCFGSLCLDADRVTR